MFGKRLMELRVASGLSREELSRQSGVSLDGIRKIEVGTIVEPKVSTRRKLAKALGIPPTAFEAEGEPSSYEEIMRLKAGQEYEELVQGLRVPGGGVDYLKNMSSLPPQLQAALAQIVDTMAYSYTQKKRARDRQPIHKNAPQYSERTGDNGTR